MNQQLNPSTNVSALIPPMTPPRRPVDDTPLAPVPIAPAPMIYPQNQSGWEYKIIMCHHQGDQRKTDHPLTEEALNELGKDGWDLVSVYQGSTTITCYLKRAM